MNITITFDNFNGGLEDGIRVYRGDTPIADGALPAPLATLPTGSTQYVDATAVRGNKYYYRFGVFKGADELVSPNKAVVAVAPNDTGPGPQALAAGDWDLGYFGYCKSSDFVTYGTMAGMLGITTGSACVDYGWNKIAYKGKVLFIARGCARYQIAFNALYLAGAVYGTNDNGALVPSGQTPTNQYHPQTVGGYTFIPRTLKGLPDGAPAPTSKYSPDATQLASHEYEDILSPYLLAPRFTGDIQYATFGHLNEVFLPITPNSYSTFEWTQAQAAWPATTGLARGLRVSATSEVRIATITVWDPSWDTHTYGYPVGGTYNMYACWRPVMELVM